jgi:surface antigen
MQGRKAGGAVVAGSLVLLGLLVPAAAQAGPHRGGGHAAGHSHAGSQHAHLGGHHGGGRRTAWRGGHLQCVPFARNDSGIELKGNASIWWNEAAGRYQRGARPERGSVLSFAASGRMRLGHVAVVANVVNAREIEIDHANWWGPGSHGGVSRGVPVVDVSPDNDWTEVRVALGNGDFGSVYRTHGFIYDRPDGGTLVAAAAPAATAPAFARPATATLQPADRIALNDEVAEAPDDTDTRTARWNTGLRGGFAAHGRHAAHGHARLGRTHERHPIAHAGHTLHAARLTGRHRG